MDFLDKYFADFEKSLLTMPEKQSQITPDQKAILTKITPAPDNPHAFYYFCSEFLGYDKPGNSFNKWSKDIHQRWCDDLQSSYISGGFRELLLKPRGTLKSTIYTICFIAWVVFLNPNIRILLVSSTDRIARQLLRAIQAVLKGKVGSYWIDLIGDLSEGSDVWNTESCIVNSRMEVLKEATITAVGAKTNIVSSHYDLIVCDDLVDKKDHDEPSTRDLRYEWFTASLSLLEPNSIGYLLVGTRWHEDDVYGRIIKMNESQAIWRVMVETAFHIDELGEWVLHFPSILSKSELIERQTTAGMLSPVLFASQYLNDPTWIGERLFELKTMAFLQPAEIMDWKAFNKIIVVDPAFGKAKGDYAAAIVLTTYITSKDVVYYVQDCICRKETPETFAKSLYTLMHNSKLYTYFCERTGNNGLYRSQIDNSINMIYNQRVQSYDYDTKEDKLLKIQGLSFPCKMGMIKFMPETLWNNDYKLLINQLFQVGRDSLGTHDDAADALAVAFIISSQAVYRQRMISK